MGLLVGIVQPVVEDALFHAVVEGCLVVINVAAFHIQGDGRLSGCLLGDDVDDAALGVGTVEYGRGALGYFDLCDVVGGQRVQVQAAVFGLVVGNAVDEHQDPVLVEEAANGHRGDVFRACGNPDTCRMA